MVDSFTILCPRSSYSEVYEELDRRFPNRIQLDGKPLEWRRIVVSFSSSFVTLTSLVQKHPGDKFSKLILSLHNFFYKVATQSHANRNYVLRRIEETEMLIGFAIEPGFKEDEDHDQCIWAVVEATEGLLFNGNAILNAEGKRLLTRDGEVDFVV